MRGGGPLGRGSGMPPAARRTSRPDQMPVRSRPYAELREVTLFHATRSLTTAEHGSRQASSGAEEQRSSTRPSAPHRAGSSANPRSRQGPPQPPPSGEAAHSLTSRQGKVYSPGHHRISSMKEEKKQVSIIPVDREGWRVLQGCVIDHTTVW